MWTRFIILTLCAVSALLMVIRHGMKMTVLDDAQDTLPVGEFGDPRSISLRGRRALDPEEVAALPPLLTNLNNAFAIDVQTDASQPKVSYVTSFWAQQKGSKVHPHRLEVRASLLANILNPHFDQVVIFLDGVKEGANCPLFLEGMVELSRTLGITSFPTTSIHHADLYSKVTCVGSPDGQPNYYQMFKNAVSDYVTGDIVVLANADQAFDNTMVHARHLNPEVLLSLGTRGYTDLISADADYFYKQVVGRVHPQYLDPANEEARAPDNCMNIPGSVDTWIFHKSKLKETLRPEPFQRRNRGGKMEFFFMNEMQAENAAIWALNKCYQFQSSYNACEKIHSWHFHLTSKTHHRGGRANPPWNSPSPSKHPKCVQEGNCFL
mmetsp:Transcript_2833/g.4340  ORF Transcript_2833/g.4340 Transcript_2833/m.4340 type:complete len:380 (+) Transcript_2833:126-1265(+)